MKGFPFTVRLTLIFILINALVWLVFALIVAVGVHPALPANVIFKWGMAGISFLAAGVLLGMYLMLKKEIHFAWYATVAVLGISSVLTFFDDVGWIDLLVLAVMMVPLVLLIKDRKWYLLKNKQE